MIDDGAGFYGVALYPQLATSDTFTIGLRGEYFAEDCMVQMEGDDLPSVFASNFNRKLCYR